MRPVRLILALLIAAIAITALTSTASATELCSKEVEKCEAKTVLGEGTAVTGSLKSETKSKFVTSLGTVECSKSSIEATTSATEAVPLPLKVSEMSFGTCTLGKTSCTVSAVNLPYHASLFAGEGGSGTVYIDEGKEESEPGQSLKCGASIECTFTEPELDLSMTAGTPTTLVAKEYVLAGAKGEHCASSMTWSATYALSAPNSGEVGASQGSQATALCKNNEASCSALYSFGQAIVGAKFQSPAVTIGTGAAAKVITCTTGSIVGKTTQNAGIPLITELKNLAFGTCTIGLHTCTVEIKGLPYTTAGLTAGTGGNGWWSTPLRLFVECATENIRGCNYEKRSSFEFFGGTFGNAKVTIPNHLIKEVSGTENCGRYARLGAIFSLTEPTEAVYLTH